MSKKVKNNKFEFTKIKVVAIIIAALSLFSLIFLWDYLNEAGRTMSVESKGLITGTIGDEATCVIDSQYSRIVVLDKDKKVRRTIQDLEHVSGQKMYYNCMIYNNMIYVLDVTMRGHTQFISKERIECYNFDGDYLGYVYERTYGDTSDDNDAYPPRIVDFDFQDDWGAIVYSNRESSVLDIYWFDATPSEAPEPAQYYNSVDFSTALDGVYIYDGAFDVAKGVIAVSTLYGDVYESSRNYGVNPIQKVHDSKDGYALSIYYDYDGKLNINTDHYDNDKTYFYDFRLTIITLIIWFSIAYLAIFLIHSIYLYFKSLIKTKNRVKIGSVVLPCVTVLIILCISLFYSFNSIHNELKDESEYISIQSTNISLMQKDSIHDCITDFNRDGRVSFEHYKKLYKSLTDVSLNFAKIDESAVFTLYSANENEEVSLLVKSGLFYPSGMPYTQLYDKEMEQSLLQYKDDDYFIFSGNHNNFLSSVTRLYDDQQNIVGFFSSETNYTLLIEKCMAKFFNLFVTLVVVLIAIFLLAFEGSKFLKALKSKLKSTKRKRKLPEVHMSRILMFLLIFVYEADSSLMVLIGKGILDTTGAGDNSVLLSLPPFVHSAAMFLGYIFFALVTSRFKLKKLGAICGSGLAVFCLLTAYAVFTKDFNLFLVAKFISVFFMSQLYSIPTGLISHADQEKTIAKVSVEMTAASLCSGILAMLFAGYIAQYFADWCIYVMAAVPAILIIILFATTFRNISIQDAAGVEITKSSSGVKSVIKFFISKNTFCFVFIVLGISTITFSFRSYVFPLLGDSFGWEKTTISNILVIANIAVYILVPLISNASKNFDYWKLIIGCMLVSAFVFGVVFLRSIPATIVFAIIAITILNKIINAYISVVIVREAAAKEVDKTRANMFTIVIRDFFGTIKSPIAGGLMTFGLPIVYAVFGIASAIGGIVFGVVTRDSSMRKSDKNNDDLC